MKKKKKKEIVSQIPLYKLSYIGQIYTIPKLGLGILDIDTQLNSLELQWILRLLNPTNAFWKGLMLYWLNLKNNSNQGLCLFRQKQIIRSSRNKNLQNQKSEVLHHHQVLISDMRVSKLLHFYWDDINQ